MGDRYQYLLSINKSFGRIRQIRSLFMTYNCSQVSSPKLPNVNPKEGEKRGQRGSLLLSIYAYRNTPSGNICVLCIEVDAPTMIAILSCTHYTDAKWHQGEPKGPWKGGLVYVGGRITYNWSLVGLPDSKAGSPHILTTSTRHDSMSWAYQRRTDPVTHLLLLQTIPFVISTPYCLTCFPYSLCQISLEEWW